jgi:S1-C subfamily serine protease
VVIVEIDGDQIIPVSHGTGFAVGPETIVTNAHVVAEARDDDELAIGIVPSDGESAVYGRLVTVSPRTDLALIATTSPLRLAPLTIAGNATADSGTVTAVGYPMNVDRAQGLSLTDIFRAQPPVKSNGTLSGRRPASAPVLLTGGCARKMSPIDRPCARSTFIG